LLNQPVSKYVRGLATDGLLAAEPHAKAARGLGPPLGVEDGD